MRCNGISALKRDVDGYPWFPPFDPHIHYPEYPFTSVSSSANPVYDMVREVLWELELDAHNRGTREWNPLRNFVKEGDTVVIKPNFALDHNQEHKGNAALAAVTTHGSVLRPMVDYAYKACGPTGRVIICDTPLYNEVSLELFNNVAATTGSQTMGHELRQRGVPVELLDLRDVVRRTGRFGLWRTYHLPGDPLGYVEFDLGAGSEFSTCDRLERLQTNDWEDVSKYHLRGHHLYSVSKTMLSAQAIINVPKLKTHKKTGLTVALKNMFGTINMKHRLPHWRRGIDDHPATHSKLHEALKRGYSRQATRPVARFLTRALNVKLDGYGNWIGNDTVWRGILDINRILMYGDLTGKMCTRRQREMLVIVDGIIAGEGLGPLAPRPRRFGGVLGGTDPVEVDIACCHLMGLDPKKVKLVANAVNGRGLPLSPIRWNTLTWSEEFWKLTEPFELPPGWEDARDMRHRPRASDATSGNP